MQELRSTRYETMGPSETFSVAQPPRSPEMTNPITPEMIAAWRTLQQWARAVCAEPSPLEIDKAAAKAIDVLDNSDFMVPIEEAGLCTYQVGGGYNSPPEYCELEIEGTDEYCPRHQKLADADSALDPGETNDPGAPHGRGKCPHCGYPRVPLTPQGLTMYHGDVTSGQGDCLGSLQAPEQPLDPAEWGDTTREDMARRQQEESCRCGGSFSGAVGGIGCSCVAVGLPELKPGEEPRPVFSDTHPRAARELGDLIRGEEQA